jgi:cobalt/nickel transport system permease protein
MHISEGILSAPVLVTGAALTVTAVGHSLKKMEHKEVPKVAILSSVFFVASLIHVPLGPSSVHLILNGIMGVLLGWTAFPAILVAVMLSGIMVAAALIFTGEPFMQVAKLVVIAHLPVMILEGALTAFCIGFLRKVRPEILSI